MPKSRELFVDFLDLEKYRVTEPQVRGGSTKKVADHPWPLPDGPKQALRDLLEAHGFDIEKDIEVAEFVDRDGFRLRQADP